MDSKVTKFIVVCDNARATQELGHRLYDLLRENGARLERYIKYYFDHCIINTRGISIAIYSKTYPYLDGLSCDYFSIATTDIDFYLIWRQYLEPRGKELITFNALKEEIKMACSLDINSINYINNDIASIRALYERYIKPKNTVQIQNVIFNDPATIIFWADGTKTVVKAQEGDTFDPEKGLAMAIAKKFMGNKGNYCNELKKWLPKEEKLGLCTMADLENSMIRLGEAMSKTFGISEQKKKYNPVQKAYDILVRARDGKNENTIDYDKLIGYLGEALND